MACYTQIAMPARPARTFSADELWEYALKRLADRAHSAGELREKLRRKASRAGDVDATLARLKESGYLDDRAYAESYAHARLDDRQFGHAGAAGPARAPGGALARRARGTACFRTRR